MWRIMRSSFVLKAQNKQKSAAKLQFSIRLYNFIDK